MILALHACCSKKPQRRSSPSENGRSDDPHHHNSATVTKVNLDEAWWLGVTSPPVMQWQTRDSTGAIISCQLETPTELTSPSLQIGLSPNSNPGQGDTSSQVENRKLVSNQKINNIQGKMLNEVHPSYRDMSTAFNEHFPVTKSTSSSSPTYCSQPEVHNDIYKKTPRVENINNHLLNPYIKSTRLNNEISQSSAPSMHLLPAKHQQPNASPSQQSAACQTVTPEPESPHAPPSYLPKDNSPPPDSMMNQYTQTILTLPIVPRKLEESLPKERLRESKLGLTQAALGSPTSTPVQPIVPHGSPISPRQSSRKSQQKIPRPSKPKCHSSEPSIIEEELGPGGEVLSVEQTRPKVVWTNEYYNKWFILYLVFIQF